jgi:hypothetical protein
MDAIGDDVLHLRAATAICDVDVLQIVVSPFY